MAPKPELIESFLQELAENPDIDNAVKKLGITKEEARDIFKSLLPKKKPVQKGLFEEQKPAGALEIYVDGASRGNPGKAGAGIVIKGPDGNVVRKLKRFLGIITNNQAEYMALITGLEAARAMNAARLKVYADSELMVKQVNGIYKVKSEELRPLYNRAMELFKTFSSYSIEHVYREKNSEADRLANDAIDGAADKGLI